LLVDSAPGPSSWLAPVVLAGDLVLAVLLADAASFATLPQLLGFFDEACTRRAAGSLHVLVNCGDDGTNLRRDLRALLGAQTHLSVLPMAIHRDEAVREALARQKGIRSHAPTGQATKDLDALADWLRAELTRKDDAEPVRSRVPSSTVIPAMVASA